MVDIVGNGFSNGFPSRKSFSFWDEVKGDSHDRAMPELEG